jgi:hypothetical protein
MWNALLFFGRARCLRIMLPCVAGMTMFLLAGCGGTGGSSSLALIRAINTSPNGGTATVDVNGGPVGVSGSGQAFKQASEYDLINSGSPQFSFTLSSQSGTSYPTLNPSLATDVYYSAILFGRADVTSSSDARYPQIKVVADDRTVPPSGQARLRIIHAAPDAGNVDVLETTPSSQTLAGGVVYTTVGAYSNFAAGSITVQVNAAGTGTVLAPAQIVTLAAGHLYSLFVLEPTVVPPTYSVGLLDDTIQTNTGIIQ